MGKYKKMVHSGRRAGKQSTMSALRAMFKGAMKAGYYDPDIDDVNYEKMAADKKWLTKDGEVYRYKDMKTEHIMSILAIFNEGKFHQRVSQERGLREELLSRMSKAGKVLFGSK